MKNLQLHPSSVPVMTIDIDVGPLLTLGVCVLITFTASQLLQDFISYIGSRIISQEYSY